MWWKWVLQIQFRIFLNLAIPPFSPLGLPAAMSPWIAWFSFSLDSLLQCLIGSPASVSPWIACFSDPLESPASVTPWIACFSDPLDCLIRRLLGSPASVTSWIACFSDPLDRMLRRLLRSPDSVSPWIAWEEREKPYLSPKNERNLK